MTGDISTGELARQVRDVFTKLDGLATRLESGQFVRTEVFVLTNATVQQTLDSLSRHIKELDNEKTDLKSTTALEARILQLEDDKKWLVRLVIGFIILGILGLLFVSTGGQL